MIQKDQLTARLRVVFLGEMEEQLRIMNADLLALEGAPTNVDRIRSLFRVAHTLKGAARAAGIPLIEECCHSLEGLLVLAREGKLVLSAKHFTVFFALADALEEAGAALRSDGDVRKTTLPRVLDELASVGGGAAGAKRAIAPKPSARSGSPTPVPSSPTATTPDVGSSAFELRIAAEKVDAVLASAGELSMTTERLGVRAAEVQALHDQLAAAAASARGPSDRNDPMPEIVRGIRRLAVAVDADARAVMQIGRQTVDRAFNLRTRPFSDACEALPRIVRDLTTAAGKDVQLRITGAEVEADRVVLDGLREPIVHMVRNAVDHGIEPAARRVAAGKPKQGTVEVAAALRGDRLTVRVSDDGAGLDTAAIRARIERDGQAAPAGDRELARMLFAGGLSTRDQATAISGRGVGLDLVRSVVERLGGTVDVEWTASAGTTFTIESPVSLATTRGLVVRAGGQPLIVPTVHVQRVARIASAELRRVDARPVVPASGGPLPLVSLARLLGPPLSDRAIGERAPIVIVEAGGSRLALAVEELVSEQDVVVRPLPSGRSTLPHFSGAAILGSGEVALIINATSVIAAGLVAADGAPDVAPSAEGRGKPRILVVDDSITTRTLEQSILEAAGYDVVTAVDGADAWRLLQEGTVDLVLTDVEMPRMDGFELCKAIRASRRLAELPVVLVTALESSADRARGHETGADAYLGKSSFDQRQLLDTIHQLIGDA